MTRPPLRVVQWATGNIGTRSLRGIIGHPGLELVGVLVHDPAKAGVDAGDLCGEPRTGVLATTDPAEVLALRPDCVVHMAGSCDVEAVTTLLAAGIDVVSTRGELTGDGAGLSDADRVRVLKACAEGGASVHATGSSPGFITEVLPMALLSIQRRVDLVAIDEFADLAHRDSPHLLFQVMGFGGSPESFSGARAQHLLSSFQPSLEQTALAAGFAVDRWTAVGETAVAVRDTTIAAGVVPAGTVGAQRTRLVGWVGEQEAVTFTATWYAVADLEPAWDLGLTGWRLAVQGDAPLVLDLPFPAKGEDLAAATPGYTANRAVNVVPWVCAAAPGFVRSIDLPAVTPVGPSV